MIVTKGLTKYYGSLAALVDLNLKINAGEIFGFIGPNGAGKTTTMRILSTLLDPTRGRAFIDGLDVTKKGKQVRSMVGYMPDFMGVYDDLKVFEYLEFFAAAFNIPRHKRKSIVDGVLELTDLQSKQTATVDSLSRGMQQRLSLARVLIHDPKALILDEPASGLDPRARIEIRQLLQELQKMGKTIMISSHILSELEEMCDHIGIIEHGKIVFNGTMEEIRQQLGVSSKVRVEVTGDPGPAVDLLNALPEVLQAKQVDKYVLVTFADTANNDGLIARTLVQGNINVIALQPEQVKLDQAFLQLTKGIVH
ncbi:MAG: ABC transporter ATP-binding protein [Planctomycetes bacterium]|nr:ABC transporter ATP-binding protein [Planctomycetota bacterium]